MTRGRPSCRLAVYNRQSSFSSQAMNPNTPGMHQIRIVTTPTGGDTEHSDYVVSNTTSNRFAAVNTTNTLTFDVWYDLPSLRREALITVQLTFKDADGITFSKSIDVLVSP